MAVATGSLPTQATLMGIPSVNAGKVAVAAATPVAVLVAAALVWQSSYAAFTGTTRNSGNNWSTGSVALSDDDAGSALFQVTGMVPNDTDSRCITVTANASVPGVVKGYSVNPVLSSTGLQDHIKMSVEHGAGGGFGSCTGFTSAGVIASNISLGAFAVGSTNYGTGMGAWTVPAGTSSRTYKITWTFDTTGLSQNQVNNFQGAQTGLDLQWELQSE